MANRRDSSLARHDVWAALAPAPEVMLRVWAVLAPLAGLGYLCWRVTHLPAGLAVWLALPALAAEAYVVGLVALFASLAVNASRARGMPPAATEHISVDVFVLAGDEPPPLLAATLRAAARLSAPHVTRVLHVADSPAAHALAQSYGCFSIDLSPGVAYAIAPDAGDGEREGALLAETLAASSGEVILLLRAGHVPDPDLLQHGLGAFSDPRVGHVQLRREQRDARSGDAGTRGSALAELTRLARSARGVAPLEGAPALIRRQTLLALGAMLAERAERAHALGLLSRVQPLVAPRTAPRAFGQVDAAGLACALAGGIATTLRTARQGAGLDDALGTLGRACAEVEDELAGLELAALRQELDLAPDADLRALICGAAGPGGFRLTYVRLSPLAALGAARLLAASLIAERERVAQAVAPVPLDAAATLTRSLALVARGWRGVYLPGLAVSDLSGERGEPSVVLGTPPRFAAAHALLAHRADLRRLGWRLRLAYLAPVYCSMYRVAMLALVVLPIVALCFGPDTLGYLRGMSSYLGLFAGASLLLLTSAARVAGTRDLLAELSRLAVGAPIGASERPTASDTVARWQVALLVALLTSVAVGGLRLTLGLDGDTAGTLSMAALAIGYAWLLWGAVAPLLFSPRLRSGSRSASRSASRPCSSVAGRPRATALDTPFSHHL